MVTLIEISVDLSVPFRFNGLLFSDIEEKVGP